ncbi:13267_t:CDS:2 [Cetraspora pellucida]|uniref:13267_t:CDS:1 n=1 Tax=Cetraspora pellucida TaxID=1433469 RepID=A0A9N9EF06_9GLOM|nr:13267_t:CDS:2 [Cetraspora pellucida]
MSEFLTTKQRSKAQKLPCIFLDLVCNYKEQGSSNKKARLNDSFNTDEMSVDDVSHHLSEFERVAENNMYIITDLQWQVEN